MSVPVLVFFSNAGGVGTTSLVYHLAWMLTEQGRNILTCDLDPQANLTASFLADEELDILWNGGSDTLTMYQCIRPLTETGDIERPDLVCVTENLYLIPGDLALADFEETLSSEWPKALDSGNLYRPFRLLTAFWQVMQAGAESMDASLILVDVGPNLGALSRSAMIASDYVITPLGADLFSLQGLRNLGPALHRWRAGWSQRRKHWQQPDFDLPNGHMQPIGYIIQQNGVRGRRPAEAYSRWINKFPDIYADTLLGGSNGMAPSAPGADENCLATMKHYRSLIPLAHEARKPIFFLTSADGALGAHATAANQAYDEFLELADRIWQITSAA